MKVEAYDPKKDHTIRLRFTNQADGSVDVYTVDTDTTDGCPLLNISERGILRYRWVHASLGFKLDDTKLALRNE